MDLRQNPLSPEFQFDGGTLTVESDSSGHHVASGNLSQITYSEQGKLLTIQPSSLDFDLQTIDKNVIPA